MVKILDKNAVSSLVEKAKKDGKFREDLIKDPIGAIKKEGYSLTPDQEIILEAMIKEGRSPAVNGCYLAHG